MGDSRVPSKCKPSDPDVAYAALRDRILPPQSLERLDGTSFYWITLYNAAHTPPCLP